MLTYSGLGRGCSSALGRREGHPHLHSYVSATFSTDSAADYAYGARGFPPVMFVRSRRMHADAPSRSLTT